MTPWGGNKHLMAEDTEYWQRGQMRLHLNVAEKWMLSLTY